MKKKIFFTFGFCVVLAAVFEFVYFQSVYHDQTNNVSACEIVLVYGGRYSRSVAGLALANKMQKPIFFSEGFGGPKDVIQKVGPSKVEITVDHFAMTTDQNARNAVQYLKKGNYRQALLVTSWFHMPRALFLTRLYLLGSGITVQPYYYETIPKNYWLEPDFWGEMFRFWGSLVRVALAAVGFEKPVFHYFD
jgi:uncharacterized SAM-binding protein YcdF (DUF218 family)